MGDAALSRIANLINSEDDLVKISSLRQQFHKEKTSIDIKLEAARSTQMKGVELQLEKFGKMSSKINNIQGEFGKMNQVYDESMSSSEEHEIITKVTNVDQFFRTVKSLYNDVSNFRRSLDQLNELIDQEYEIISEDITYPLDNLLRIYYNLDQQRNFQEYLELGCMGSTDDLKSIVYKITQPMKKTIKKFDDLLGEIIISITEAVKEGNMELVFKFMKIIEQETTNDLAFSLKSSLNLKTPDIKYNTTRYQKRNYRKFFYAKLEDSLFETFDKCVEHFGDDKMLVYDNLNWLEDELVFVNDTLSHLFPESWGINSFIQNSYYNKLHNFTMDIIKTDPPAEDLFRILSYDSHYNKFLAALQSMDDRRKSVIKPQNKSIIGEDLKNVVLDDYLKVIVSKMDEWNENLIEQETNTFKLRDIPPDMYNYHQVIEDEDANDQPVLLDIETTVYVLPDFKTPLTMLKEQADVAADSGYGKILVGVIGHWSACYIKRIERYKKLIEEEFESYMAAYSNEDFLIKESKTARLFKRKKDKQNYDGQDDSPQFIEGFIEYLAALGNTFEINTDRLQDKFLPTYREKVHTSYQLQIETSFDNTITPGTDLNAQIIRTIVDIIINDLYPVLSKIFTSKWYDDGKSQTRDDKTIAEQIVETIVEYMEEIRGYTAYDFYSVMFNVFLDTFIPAYIRIGYENILHGDGKKIDPHTVKKFKSFSEAVGRDVTALYGGLESLFTRKDASYLLNSLRAIEFLGDLATCEDPMEFIPQIWENEILGSFYYCSVEYVRGICVCRKDMDKNQVNLLINQLTKTQKIYHSQVSPPDVITGTLNDFYYN